VEQTQPVRIAILTEDDLRVEAVAQAAQTLDWEVLALGSGKIRDIVRRNQVNLVLVDLDISNAITRLTELAQTLPGVVIMALATPQHLVDLQDALLAGAEGFIAFPIEPGQFIATVQRVLQSAPKDNSRSHRGQIVAVAGLKGGIGRTTLAANMAVDLRRRIAEDVILVEAHHSMGDVALMLNLTPRHTLASLAEEANLDIDVIQGHLQLHASNIKALVAPPDVEQLVTLPAEMWSKLLQTLAELAPYVIVDTAAIADDVLSEVLTAADEIVVVTGPDLASLRSAVVLLQTIDEAENVHGGTHVVLNRAGVKGGVSEAASREQLGQEIIAAIPDDPALATFAVNRGVPFTLSHPSSILAKDVNRLVSRIFDFSLATPAQGKPAGAKKKKSLLPFFNK
jgi:pilus assembly protein CpaE